MAITTETFRDLIIKAAGSNLSSLTAYGSYASGDRVRNSDINTILALKDACPKELKKISGAIIRWIAAGNPPPLIFAEQALPESADIFPMEFMDIKENNIVLAGKDIFKTVKVSPANLRLEAEREIQGALMRLRSSYVLSGGSKARIISLMRDSVSAYAVLLKPLIRLSGKKPPALKKEIIAAAPAGAGADKNFMLEVLALKNGNTAGTFRDYESAFERYVKEWEKIRHYAQSIRLTKKR